MAFKPDPKNGPRIKDPKLMKELHARWDSCALCPYLTLGEALEPNQWGRVLSLHHVLPKGSPHFGDDVEANLIMLCGSGTTGHHGQIEAGSPVTCYFLGEHLQRHRQDVIEYVHAKLGHLAGDYWLNRHLAVATICDTREGS